MNITEIAIKARKIATRLGLTPPNTNNISAIGDMVENIHTAMEKAPSTAAHAGHVIVELAAAQKRIVELEASGKSKDDELEKLRKQVAQFEEFADRRAALAVARAMNDLAIPPVRDSSPISSIDAKGNGSANEPRGYDRVLAATKTELAKFQPKGQ